jgi:DNA (cytosine-5)-methyltransferase 1
MKHIGLFEGIGGFSLAARWAGWETVAWCEWNEFGQRVLRHHFPEAKGYGDITQTNFTQYADTIDIVTGGFPCQPYSLAGKRKGKDDNRHLWPEMLRAIREIRPRWVVGENVLGLVNWNGGLVFHEVQTDLEAAGYEVWPYVLPACAVNAPHRRDRVWFVAYSENFNAARGGKTKHSKRQGNTEIGRELWDKSFSNGEVTNATNTNCNGLNQRNNNDEEQPGKGGFNALNDFNEATMHTNSTSKPGEHIGQTREGKFNGPDSGDGFDNFQNFPTQSPVCGGDDGLPTRLDGITFPKWRNESIKAYGNAIVPQVAYELFKVINQMNLAKDAMR